jgi:large subunit ribosomal protein L37Ae
MATKKLKSTARFGARYGSKIKQRVLEIEQKKNQKFNCPNCGFPKVKRKARGIFYCKKCNAKFTGGAFIPETLTGRIIKKMVSQKSFLPAMKELIAVSEKIKHNPQETTVQEPAVEKHSEKKREKHAKEANFAEEFEEKEGEQV